MMSILNFRNLELSDIYQGIHKHAIQKKLNFSAFLESKFEWKEKKTNLSYPGLRYAHKKLNYALKKKFRKMLFAYKIRFAVEKKNKFYGKFSKLLCRHQKKMPVIQFSYMEIVW